MAKRGLLALVILLLCLAQASSDLWIQQDNTYVKEEVERGTNKRLFHNIGLLKFLPLSRYLHVARPPALAMVPSPSPHPSAGHLDCGGLCKHRCSLHSRPNLCIRACGTCCVRCNCVPPGTFGNREMCGKCYTDMTTHGNKTKCP